MLLAIETSCDETAVALVNLAAAKARNEISSKDLVMHLIRSQMLKHQPYGGVVPELAAREHLLELPKLVAALLNESSTRTREITAVAATTGPGLKGCLLVGHCYGLGLAQSLAAPFVAIHHLEAHLWAWTLLPKAQQPQLPLLALVVSGGHTLLVLVRALRDYVVVAETRDDAAGEAFDKIATLLGLPYPGGPALAKLAEGGDDSRYTFAVGMKADPTSFSFSGLKTAVARCAEKQGEDLLRADLAASAQAAIVQNLVEKSLCAVKSYQPKSFLLTGGVAANRCLREKLQTVLDIPLTLLPMELCTDNAAMVGALGAQLILAGKDSEIVPLVRPRWELGDL